ncbi:MAG: PQQ-dependent sugar dehydrogenase [Pseudomonadota bacterium]|nr:PQQ-dependent sugar dehydrogenase [Pseudomonadota bacterium]
MIVHARFYLLCLAYCLMCACGGSGSGSGDNHVNPPAPAATTGSLVVTIASVPTGSSGAVHITGPNNFLQDLTQTTTLSTLAPGAYTVSAGSISVGSTIWTPSPASQVITVTAGATANAAVVYGNTALSLAAVEVATAVSPVFLTAPAGDARQFIVERAGRIRILQNGTLLTQPFLDISARVFTGGEGGLLSIAFDPRYAANGYVYLYYIDNSQNITIERFTVSGNVNLADAASGLVIISIPHPDFTNHFGGQVAFGADGFLYLGTGDGGGGGDPLRNAQNLNVLLGKMLRLDVSAATVAQRYAIPSSNPYAGQTARRGEIWAAGLRNPWRFTFDSGLAFIADVGQDRREEVDIVDATAGGLNYGWNITEGTACYNATSCDQAGLTAPAFDYEHGTNNVNGCSITGGFVYRGTALPELAGRYFYSDYCTGFLKSVVPNALRSGITEQRDWNITGLGNIVSFGRDGSGELYLIAGNGKIYRISRK